MQITLEKIEKANSLISRGLGLIGKKGFGKSHGLLLTKTNSIHTFFVFFPIDVLFLDKEMKVIRTLENLKPFRISPIEWKADSVLELPVGTILAKSIKIDDQINLV